MTNTIKADYKGNSDVDCELGSTILNYLLQGQTVVLDSDFVPENHLETLFENIRDNLLKLVKQGDISYERFQKALTNLVTKSSLEGMNLPNATPIIVRMQMQWSLSLPEIS